MYRPLGLLVIALVVASAVDADEQAPTSAKTETKAAKSEAKQGAASAKKKAAKEAEDPEKVDWSKVDWTKRLDKLQYKVMRRAGTERAFTGKYWDFFKDGQYRCAGCGLPLFDSEAKFDSDCGWPSFDKSIAKDAITEHEDLTLFQPRVEIRCRRCGSHLGHVFNDGPTKTGLRYCLNSVAMDFVPEKQLKTEAKTKSKSRAVETAKPAGDGKDDKTPAKQTSAN
jgi:peptide-methionine (R)-S-oxide reductase